MSGRQDSGTPLWSGPRPFVGRQEILGRLVSEVEAVAEESGRAVFLIGPPGSGKTALLGLFQEVAYRRYKDLDAQYVDCVHTGPGNEAWVQLARLLTRGDRVKRSTRRLAMEWFEVIPVVGDLIKAIAATVNVFRTGRPEEPEDEELVGSDAASAVAQVRLLLRHDPLEHRLVILDNLDEADEHELAGSFALVRQLEKTRTLFVGGVSTRGGRPPEGVAGLMLEAERLGRTRVIRLPPLDAEAVAEALSQATGTAPPPAWLEWVVSRTGGLPAGLWSALGTLASRGALLERSGAWEWAEEPPRGGVAADSTILEEGRAGPNLQALEPRQRRLLGAAALQGTPFGSGSVAELTELDELAVEDGLSSLVRQGLLEYRGTVETGDLPESRYAFLEPGLREACLAQLSGEERKALEARMETSGISEERGT